jgi:hypothetical protein
MAQGDIIYKGEDREAIVNLGTVNFADLIDFIALFRVDAKTVKVMKKTATGQLQLLPIAGEPTKCLIRLFHNETVTWPCGILYIEMKSIDDNVNFPLNKHLESVQLAAKIEETNIQSIV